MILLYYNKSLGPSLTVALSHSHSPSHFSQLMPAQRTIHEHMPIQRGQQTHKMRKRRIAFTFTRLL